jgi:Domain of unknown function (DUF4401)
MASGITMTTAQPNVEQVFNTLQHEEQVAADWRDAVLPALTAEAEESPWYIRSMIAFGAWVASLFLMAFIGGIGAIFFSNESGLIVIALLTLAGVTLLRRRSSVEFVQHLLLAFSLGAQILLAFGLAVTFRNASIVMLCLICIQGALILYYPDRLLQFLTVMAIVAELVFLIFDAKHYLYLHGLIVLLAVSAVWLAQIESRVYTGSWASLHAPIYHAVLLSLLGVMLLSTVYVIPDWHHILYFPKSWIATLTMGVVLLYMVQRLLRRSTYPVRQAIQLFVYAGTLGFILLSWRAPGLVTALLVMLLGFHYANRFVIGMAIAFFGIFLTAFFYGIEVSLLHKSYTLMGTGALLLLGWYLLHLQRREAVHA